MGLYPLNSSRGCLLELVASSIEGRAPADECKSADLSAVLSLACRHKVSETVYNNAMLLSPDESIALKWRENYEKSVRFDIIMRREARIISDEFEKRGLSFFFLKGFALKAVYPLPQMRTMCDIDIFINNRMMSEYSKIMLNLGFEGKIDKKSAHDSYKKPPVSYIELHRTLSVGKKYSDYFVRFAQEGLDMCGKTTHTLPDERQLIFIIYHAAKHFTSGGTGIRTVADIYLFTKNSRGLNLDYVRGELEKIGLLAFYDGMLGLGAVWFENALAGTTEARMSDYILKSGVYGTKKHYSENKVTRSADSRGSLGKAKCKAVFTMFFPPLSVMTARYSLLSKAPFLLPFFYIIRGLRIAIFGRENFVNLKYAAGTKKSDYIAHCELLKRLGLD